MTSDIVQTLRDRHPPLRSLLGVVIVLHGCQFIYLSCVCEDVLRRLRASYDPSLDSEALSLSCVRCQWLSNDHFAVPHPCNETDNLHQSRLVLGGGCTDSASDTSGF